MPAPEGSSSSAAWRLRLGFAARFGGLGAVVVEVEAEDAEAGPGPGASARAVDVDVEIDDDSMLTIVELLVSEVGLGRLSYVVVEPSRTLDMA